MLNIKRARAEDFEKIYPLLLELDNRLAKDDWSQIFINHYGGKENYFGFVALDQEEAVGFMGLIFSEKTINGKINKFGNMTTWILKKEYRRGVLGLLLLREILKLEDYTLTALTSGGQTVSTLKRYGFKTLETTCLILLPVPTICCFSSDKCSIVLDIKAIESCLSDTEKKIFHDHQKLKCLHFTVKAKNEYCYVIAKKISIKKMPFIQLHYISNLDVFLKYLPQVRNIICFPLRVFGMLIEERFLKGHKIKRSFARPCRGEYFKSSTLAGKDITDNLYTELLVLID